MIVVTTVRAVTGMTAVTAVTILYFFGDLGKFWVFQLRVILDK